jgi:hypothetical protein
MNETIDIFDPMFKFHEEKIEVKKPETKQVEVQEEKKEEVKIDYPPPYIDRSGREVTLVIPCFCDPKYRWWQNGQSIYKTLVELNAEEELIVTYCGRDKLFWY